MLTAVLHLSVILYQLRPQLLVHLHTHTHYSVGLNLHVFTYFTINADKKLFSKEDVMKMLLALKLKHKIRW